MLARLAAEEDADAEATGGHGALVSSPDGPAGGATAMLGPPVAAVAGIVAGRTVRD